MSKLKLTLCAFPGDIYQLNSSTQNCNTLFKELAETQRQNTLFQKADV